MKRLILFFAVALVTSGCAFHSGIATDSTSLSSANYKFVQSAQGSASATYFLVFGGLGKEGLALEAKKDLLRNYPLAKNQTLANITYDEKMSFFIIVFVKKVTITADIVEFTN